MSRCTGLDMRQLACVRMCGGTTGPLYEWTAVRMGNYDSGLVYECAGDRTNRCTNAPLYDVV